jgi:hypothetical protein
MKTAYFALKEFELKDLILEASHEIYNNIATVENIKGRFTAEFKITTRPLITWEFECLDEAELVNFEEEKQFFRKPIDNIIANRIEIINPYCRILEVKHKAHSKLCCAIAASGFSKEMCIGDISTEINALTFYIPNFRLHAICREHNIKDEDSRLKYGPKDNFIFDAPFFDNWTVSFETKYSSFEWLDAMHENTGILISSVGKIYQREKDRKKNVFFRDLNKSIEDLFLLLSFANGGYIFPIFFEGYKFPPEEGRSFSIFKYFNSKKRITLLEQLSNTWFIGESDITKLIQCVNEFTSVFASSNWRDSFKFILANYFLATSTPSWQIAASSIGAVLERLAYLILFEDEKNPIIKKSNKRLFAIGKSKERIISVLEKIGLTKKRGINDIEYVRDFIDTRNDAVHPISKKVVTEEERWKYIRYGIQWAEEMILWRIGYSGWYRDRFGSPKDDNRPYQAGRGKFVARYHIAHKKVSE